jgi:putative flippase GtrA
MTDTVKKDKKTELKRMGKYILCMISAGLVETVSYVLLFNVLHLQEWLAYLIAVILSVVWNFTINRKFTFHSANNVPIAMAKTAGYNLVFIPLSTWWTAALVDAPIWGGLTGTAWPGDIVFVFTMLMNLLTEWPFDRYIVFGKSIDTAK